MSEWRQCSLEETHQLLAGILESFAAYCDAHDLKYYLVGGTLLGAVRHKGFIPWDDDIDVGMPREDYERLLVLVKNEPIRDDLYVISGEEGTFTWPFAEVVMNGTKVERESRAYIEDQYQVDQLFIDVFPQDGWPSTRTGAKRLLKRMRWHQFWFQLAKARAGAGTTALRKVLKTPFVWIAGLVGAERIRDRIIRIAKKRAFSESENVGCVANAVNGIGEWCLRSEVENYEIAQFEGKEYTIPGSWKYYLSVGYGRNGDFMTLPPESERKTHRMNVYRLED